MIQNMYRFLGYKLAGKKFHYAFDQIASPENIPYFVVYILFLLSLVDVACRKVREKKKKGI